jgi:hypothetical protein
MTAKHQGQTRSKKKKDSGLGWHATFSLRDWDQCGTSHRKKMDGQKMVITREMYLVRRQPIIHNNLSTQPSGMLEESYSASYFVVVLLGYNASPCPPRWWWQAWDGIWMMPGFDQPPSPWVRLLCPRVTAPDGKL